MPVKTCREASSRSLPWVIATSSPSHRARPASRPLPAPPPRPARTSSSSSPTTWAGRTSAGTAGRSRRRTSTSSRPRGHGSSSSTCSRSARPTRAALMTGRYPMRHGLQVGVVRPWAQYGLPLEERTLPQALQGGGLRDGHLRQVAPRPLPARVPADPPRVRPPVRPLQRRARLLHPHPRRRLRLAPRRQGLPRRGLQHAPHRRRGGRGSIARARPARSRCSSTCRSTPSTRRTRCPTKYKEPYADLDGAAADLRRHGRGDGRGRRPDRRRARRRRACGRTRSSSSPATTAARSPGVVTEQRPAPRRQRRRSTRAASASPAFATWQGHIKPGIDRRRSRCTWSTGIRRC